jgi:hypothetical protein
VAARFDPNHCIRKLNPLGGVFPRVLTLELRMSIYELAKDSINPLPATTFSLAGVQERRDLQRVLREHVEVIAPDTLVIAEEFGEWEDSRLRIDLLGIDKEGNLVVIELKRTEDGGLMELQSIRYASMVSTMTFDKAVDVFGRYLKLIGKEDQDPRATILEFLHWEAPDDDKFAQDVRIVLASAEFSKELTSSVLWLIDHSVDIRCVRLKPYSFDARILVDVQQIIPLPDTVDYQVQLREKVRKEREARTGGADWTRFNVQIGDEGQESMWKRNAIFFVCKRLCEKGVDPDEIAALFDWRTNSVWCSVDGNVDGTGFQELAAKKAASKHLNFDRRRWFCGNEELCHINGKTYAFSNQWGATGWHKAMDLLKAKYAQFKIDFVAST